MQVSTVACPVSTSWKFPAKLPGARRVVSLEQGTCCDRAMTFFMEHAFELTPERVFVPSFIAGLQRAKDNPGEIVLLPHVHETCSAVTTSEDWELLADLAFPFANPPLFLARRPGSHSTSLEGARCATIERLKPLLRESEASRLQFEFVPTTQAAARACMAWDGPELCITNQHGVERYGLDVVRQLKHMIIWWMPFRWGTREEAVNV